MMRQPFLTSKALLAAALATILLPAHAAEANMQELLDGIKRLSSRMAALEHDNAELRRRLEAQPAEPALAERIKLLEDNNARLEVALEGDNISENEPELATRLKAVEAQTLGMQKPYRIIESLEGIHAEASFTSVWQKPSGHSNDKSKVNYRADASVTIPAGEIGNATGTIHAHFRIGQGLGVAEQIVAFAGPNSSAFQLGSALEPDTSAVMLAEAYYQAEIPLPLGGFKPQSKQTLTIGFGKMDPFVFFDQNAAASDETHQFLSSMFVHNALLDNPLAANLGADGYGFSPGVHVSWLKEATKQERYRLSLGIFGAGPGAAFDGAFESPFVIAQAEAENRYFGEPGHYRVMLWRNGQAPTYVADELHTHRGIGLNFDQRMGDYVTVFGRYGKAWGKHLPFDQTLSLGAEFGGSYWNRAGDALGVAVGFNRASRDFSKDSLTLDADADGNADYGFRARGAEKVIEAYYRYRINQHFELTPDIQWIGDPAADKSASSVTILGLRAQIMY